MCVRERRILKSKIEVAIYIRNEWEREREREKGLYSCAADIFVDDNTWMSLLVRDGAVNVSEVTVFCLTFGLGGQNYLELASWSFMNFLFFLLLFCVSHWIGVRHVACWGESCLLVVVVVVATLVDFFFFMNPSTKN